MHLHLESELQGMCTAMTIKWNFMKTI